MSKRKRREEDPEAGPSQKNLRTYAATENDRGQENEMDSSQQPDFQYTATMGDEGEVGLIEAVKLKNFMCHEKLDVKFGPHCNFLIGRNGSGKSAILTGIVVGLGGKANITNRGSSIKGFIKSNKSVAEVQVTLRNRGTDAFKPDLYGKSITVVRKLSDGGGGGYKLLSADGRCMSVKKEELDHILDQFNIQVDNPVAILNQDTSRNFLHSKNAHDKYMFFLKATQLEQMKHDYVRANESKEIAVGILNDKQGTLPGLEQEVFEWEQKYKALASLDELRKKVQKLKDEMAWALISEKEKGLEPISKSLKLEEARTPKFLQKVSETADKVKECMERKKDAEQQLKATSKEVEVLEPQHSKLKKSWDEKKKSYRSAQMAFRKVRSELESNKKERNEILKRIEDLKNSSQQDYQGERQRREKKIATLEEKVEALKAQQRVTEHSLEQFRAAVNRSKEQQYNLKAEEADCKTRMDQVKRELHNLEQSKTNKMRRYGPWMPDLMRKIDQAANQGVFHKKPLGPIGAFITARDPKWALAIEVCLKGLIHAFCVHDHHDEKILETLFNQACPDGKKPSTITCPFFDEVYNVSRNVPGRDRRWTTIMNELEVNNPVVMNTLIDQRTIESVLLFHEKEEGRKIMIKEKPRNVREGFDANGDQLFCHPTFRYYSNTSIAKANFLSASVEESIRNLKEELPRFEAEKAQIRERVQGLDMEIRKNTSEQRKCETQLTKIRNQMGMHSMEITELKNVEDPAPVDVTTLEEEVENYNQQINQLQEKHDGSSRDSDKEKSNVDAVERELKDIDKKIKHAIDQSEPVKELLASIDNEIEIAKSHESHYKAKMKEHEKKIQELRQQHNDYKKELEESISKAEQICPRMRTRRTAQNLESEINQINKRIRTEEKNRGNHEEITRKYHETFTKFKKIKKEVQQLTNFLKALDAVMDQRQRQFFEFRRMIALRAKYFFIVMLANRHYTGKISFNHQNESLTLSVQPTMVNGEGAKDMKALSGGERSFATVCFILSLWDAMESPFRCLDEFDVFMDMVNRRISMDMMLDVAGKQKGRQFIFLTPQDMSSLAHRKNVRIFELRPPERGQTTINFPTAARRNEEEEDEDRR